LLAATRVSGTLGALRLIAAILFTLLTLPGLILAVLVLSLIRVLIRIGHQRETLQHVCQWHVANCHCVATSSVFTVS